MFAATYGVLFKIAQTTASHEHAGGNVTSGAAFARTDERKSRPSVRRDRLAYARSADEAERQAKGEDVIKAAYDEDREAALEQAKDMVAGGAGQQDGLGSEA